MSAVVEFCGERYPVDPDLGFVVGREGDLAVDDNLFLHRRFLQVAFAGGLWWLRNVGAQLSATVSDVDGRLQAWLAPGASLPLVFPVTAVRFTAGPTTYEFEVHVPDTPFVDSGDPGSIDGATTVGHTTLTPDQRRLVVALAEPVLRGDGRGASELPSSAAAAERLGWTSTRFNRKLDNVCQKLAKLGVRGLHGGPDRLASNRRARLVEYAVSSRLVTAVDLALLDTAPAPVDDGDD